MRLLRTAVMLLLSCCAGLPAWALDDTPTQTPFPGQRLAPERTMLTAARLTPARRVAPEQGRRAAALPPPAALPSPDSAPRPLPAVPLAQALPAAGRAPTALNRAIGLR